MTPVLIDRPRPLRRVTRLELSLPRFGAWAALAIALACGCKERQAAQTSGNDARPAVVYPNDPHNGQPLALIPITAERCQADRAAASTYKMLGLWRLAPTDARGEQFTWSRVQVLSAQETRLRCNELTPVSALAAIEPLQVATYWVVAEVDGRRESAVILSGVDRCQDLMIGPPPPGTRPVCYLADRPTGPINRLANVARAVFAPDPQALQP